MEIGSTRIASIATYGSEQGASVANSRGGCQRANAEASAGHAFSADRPNPTGGQVHWLRAPESGLESPPVVDSQRVAAVRNAVEQGTFVINPERIADKLIGLEQALTDSG